MLHGAAKPPTIADLRDPARFELMSSLAHSEIAPFVAQYYWRRRSWITWAHYLASAALLGWWVWMGIARHYSFDQWMTRFGNAVLSFVVLLPIHDGVHGAVYRLLGATDVRYGASLRKMYAYAIAHRFVAGRRAFAWVTVTPLLIINTALALALYAFPGQQFYLMGVLLLHTAGTSGDVAMLNYLWTHRHRVVFTYDDAAASRSYFYASAEDASAERAGRG
ncbi:MAG: DUF3267 domain-containing protein [Acidobacteriota bacterium]